MVTEIAHTLLLMHILSLLITIETTPKESLFGVF